MIVDFERRFTKGDTEEVVRGKVYYRSPHTIILRVAEPVDQWIKYEDKTMLIYYPNEAKAFLFKSKHPVSPSFVESTLHATSDDLGLSKDGFDLDRTELKGDSLLVFWKPPKKIREVLGFAKTIVVNDRLVSVEMQDKKGRRQAKTTFHDYQQIGMVFFPSRVVTVGGELDKRTIDDVRYTDPRFDVPFPDEIVNFYIPPEVDIEEMDW